MIEQDKDCPICEALLREIENLRVEALAERRHGYYIGFAKADEQNTALREALRNIQIEAEREKGSWVHLKRVIALNCKAALEQAND